MINSKIVWIILFLVFFGLIYFVFLKGNFMAHNTGLTLTSSSFKNGAEIPAKYTCDGENISPQLSWSLKSDKKPGSYVLIVDDPDAKKVVGKTFVHWILLLPPEITELPEGISKNISNLGKSVKELSNNFGKTNYGGPCPPAESGTHKYRFTLFALKEDVEYLSMHNLPQAPFTAEEFKEKLAKSILAEAQITGKYTRQK